MLEILPMKEIDRNACPIVRSAKVVGDTWSLLILRELFLEGPRKFQDFEAVLGISPNTLSSRLKKLETDGIVERRFYSEHPPRAEYRLSAKGKDLAPVMDALWTWGTKYAETPKVD